MHCTLMDISLSLVLEDINNNGVADEWSKESNGLNDQVARCIEDQMDHVH